MHTGRVIVWILITHIHRRGGLRVGWSHQYFLPVEYNLTLTFKVNVNTDGVFFVIGNDTEIGGMFLRLKNTMVSELHLQWDIVFLKQYITEGMVSKSLRWEVQPQQGDLDLDSWYRYFNEAGINFLGFLISRKQSRLQVLDREIKELKDKLLNFKNSTEYNSLSTNLQSHLEQEDWYQKIKKHKKYSRDPGDYKSKIVFNWQKVLVTSANPESSPTMYMGNQYPNDFTQPLTTSIRQNASVDLAANTSHIQYVRVSSG